MTFDLRTKLLIDGAWVDVSTDVAYSSGVTITRGRADADSRVQASTWSGVLNDGVGPDGTRTPGQYNPRNPRSDYYGLIGVGTELRQHVEGVAPAPSVRSLATVEESGGTWTCPAPSGAVAGSDVLLCFLTADSGTVDDTALDEALDRGPMGGGDWNVLARVNTANLKTRVWWREARADDPASFEFNATSSTTAVVAIVAVQDTGGSPPVVGTPTTSTTAIGTGGTVSTPGISPDSTTDLELRWVGAVDTSGASSAVSWAVPAGYVEQADLQATGFSTGALASKQLASDAATTALNFTATVPAGTLDDQHGVTVSLAADSIRFHGEVTSWPKRADSTGRHVYLPLAASGILQRLTSNSTALRSPLYRAHIAAGPIAYWPGEDGSDATVAAAGIPGLQPMEGSKKHSYAIADSYVTFGSTASRGAASLIDLKGGGALQGRVPTAGNDGTSQRFECVAQFTRGNGAATDSNFVTFFSGDYEWTLIVDNASLVLDVIRVSPADHPITITHSTAELYDDFVHHYAVDIEYDSVLGQTVVTLYLDGVEVGTQNWATQVSPIRDVVFNFRKGTGDTMPAVGHAAVYSPIPAPFVSTTADAGTGHDGERAADRIERLGREEGIVVRIIGDASASARLGPQRIVTLVQLFDDAMAADQGVLYEPRSFLGLAYRTGTSLFNQEAVNVSYSASVSADLAEQLEPTEDTSDLYNAVTASRVNGSSVIVEEYDGRLGITRAGRREEAPDFNVYADAQLTDLASWRLHLGTWDEDRQSAITLGLHRDPFADSITKTRAVAGLDIGDALTITDPPTWLPPDSIEGITQGGRESLTQFTWTISYNTTPGGPYRAFVMEDDTLGRLHTNGSVLGEALSAGSGSALNSNPNFETTISPWTGSGGTVVRSTAQAHEGAASGFLTPDGVTAGVRILSETVTGLSAGIVYRAEGWVRCAASRSVSIQVLWQDGAGASLSTSSTAVAVTADTWTFLSANYTAPSSTARAILRFELGSTPPASHTLYVDEAKLTAQSSFKVATTDRAAPKWTTDTTQTPFRIRFGGEVAAVNSVTDHTLSFVSVGTVAHGTAASITPSAPAGRAVGDLLVMLVAARGTAGRVSTPTGYVRWSVFPTTSNVQVYARIATNTAADLPAVSFTGLAGTDTTSGQLACFRSSAGTFYSAGNLLLSSAECLNTSAQNIQCPGLRKPLSDNCLILYVGWKADDWTSVATLTGATEIAEASSTLGDDQGIVWDYAVQTSRTVVGAQAFAVTGGAAAISRGAVLAVRSDMQTFAVTRAQLGSFSRAHAAGTDVALYPKVVMAL